MPDYYRETPEDDYRDPEDYLGPIFEYEDDETPDEGGEDD